MRVARARREGGARERVERDQVHLGAEPVQELHQATRVGVGVVLAGEHDVLEGDALAPRERHLAAGGEERRQRVAAVDRHEPLALLVGRAVQRDREVDARLGDEARDQRREPDRRDRDPARRDRVAPLGGQDLGREPDGVVVGERLAHAHEDDVRDGRGRREPHRRLHLPDDLAGRRFRTRPICAVAQNPHPMPQPAWLEMQRVRRSRAPPGRSVCGMSTLSIDAGRPPGSGAGSAKRSFRVPSLASATWLGASRAIVKVSASAPRSPFPRFDMAAKSSAPRRWTQTRTWAAR